MSKLYNKPFKVGVLFSILILMVCNFYVYFIAYKEHSEYLSKRESHGGSSSLMDFPIWGFPFNWHETFVYLIPINLLVLIVACFIFGFLFKFVWSKISAKRLN
jgi:uncharacterized protein YneF (UPF0154 family)